MHTLNLLVLLVCCFSFSHRISSQVFSSSWEQTEVDFVEFNELDKPQKETVQKILKEYTHFYPQYSFSKNGRGTFPVAALFLKIKRHNQSAAFGDANILLKNADPAFPKVIARGSVDSESGKLLGNWYFMDALVHHNQAFEAFYDFRTNTVASFMEYVEQSPLNVSVNLAGSTFTKVFASEGADYNIVVPYVPEREDLSEKWSSEELPSQLFLESEQEKFPHAFQEKSQAVHPSRQYILKDATLYAFEKDGVPRLSRDKISSQMIGAFSDRKMNDTQDVLLGTFSPAGQLISHGLISDSDLFFGHFTFKNIYRSAKSGYSVDQHGNLFPRNPGEVYFRTYSGDGLLLNETIYGPELQEPLTRVEYQQSSKKVFTAPRIDQTYLVGEEEISAVPVELKDTSHAQCRYSGAYAKIGMSDDYYVSSIDLVFPGKNGGESQAASMIVSEAFPAVKDFNYQLVDFFRGHHVYWGLDCELLQYKMTLQIRSLFEQQKSSLERFVGNLDNFLMALDRPDLKNHLVFKKKLSKKIAELEDQSLARSSDLESNIEAPKNFWDYVKIGYQEVVGNSDYLIYRAGESKLERAREKKQEIEQVEQALQSAMSNIFNFQVYVPADLVEAIDRGQQLAITLETLIAESARIQKSYLYFMERKTYNEKYDFSGTSRFSPGLPLPFLK